MQGKYTERAQKVMSLARREAQRLNSEFIGTEHLIIAILDEGGGIAAKVLKNLNVGLKRLRQEIEKLIMPSTSPTVALGQLPFSPRTKTVLECAWEYACELGHEVVATEHMLLGILKEKESIAAQVLINLGFKLDEVRDLVLEVIGSDAITSPDRHKKGAEMEENICTHCKGTGREPLAPEVQEVFDWLAAQAKARLGWHVDEKRGLLEWLAGLIHEKTVEAYEKGREAGPKKA